MSSVGRVNLSRDHPWWRRAFPRRAKRTRVLFWGFWAFVALGVIGTLFPPDESPKRQRGEPAAEREAATGTSAQPAKPDTSETSRAPRPARKPKPSVKPRPKPKPKPEATPDRRPDGALVRQRFYLAMDDDAIALDGAVGLALDGNPGASARIREVEQRIRGRLNARLLKGGETSVAANLLLSAAGQARGAIKVGDLARLADARQEITTARDKLAEETLN